MIKRRKRGIILILVGVGISLVLLFFQEDGVLFSGRNIIARVERTLTPEEVLAYEKYLDNRPSSENPYYDKWMRPIDLSKQEWTITKEKRFIFNYNYVIGISILIILIGIGMIILSYFPEEDKPKKREDT